MLKGLLSHINFELLYNLNKSPCGMNRIYTLFPLLLISLTTIAQERMPSYDYTFKITNLSDSTDSVAYMANYYGSKQYYFDTATFTPDGVVHFKGDSIMVRHLLHYPIR